MKTALYPSHQKNGAKFTTFADFEMPLQYESILKEHQAVRSQAGLFDVSHMGAIKIIGPDTLPFLDLVSTNTVIGKPLGKVFYTVLCNDQGGAIDDVLMGLMTPESSLLVVNAGNRQAVLMHLKKVAMRFQVELIPFYEGHGILSLQGPQSASILNSILPSSNQLQSKQIICFEKEGYLSRTGYTGEDGFEIIAPEEKIKEIWELLLGQKQTSLKLCGLGARDLLRLEMGYALYGHELSLQIKPIESVAAWTVKLNAHDFIGKNAQIQLKNSNACRHAVGLLGLEQAIAREKAPIILNGTQIGTVTSGTYSPSCKAPIALGLVDHLLSPGELVKVEVRQQLHSYKICTLPFIKRDL